eukprot:1046593-Pleurochrysis_carterae.AAC.1
MLGKHTSKIGRDSATMRDEMAEMPRLWARDRCREMSHHSSANACHSLRCGGLMPHRWPRPFPSIRSMKVVWSCSSFCATASRTLHSFMAAMPASVARIASTPVVDVHAVRRRDEICMRERRKARDVTAHERRGVSRPDAVDIREENVRAAAQNREQRIHLANLHTKATELDSKSRRGTRRPMEKIDTNFNEGKREATLGVT